MISLNIYLTYFPSSLVSHGNLRKRLRSVKRHFGVTLVVLIAKDQQSVIYLIQLRYLSPRMYSVDC